MFQYRGSINTEQHALYPLPLPSSADLVPLVCFVFKVFIRQANQLGPVVIEM